jgi:hypothetical protein
MTKPANRWLLVCAASALALGTSACHKSQTATDLSNADATAAAPAMADNAGAMSADNTAATNDMSSNSTSAPAQ